MRYSVLITLVALGCGAEPRTQKAGPIESLEETGFAMVDTAARTGVADAGEKPLPTEGTLDRKIIYTAGVELVVEDFDPVPAQVNALAKQFGGYVASSNLSGSPGRPRRGEWTLRVPVDRHEDFIAAARELGEVHRDSVDSQDVTEEYYDVEARIRNKKKAEERLLDLLEKTTGELEDVLAVERELSRVREEIERVEGRLRVLADLTSLTTVSLTISEIKDYVPDEAAPYVTRVRRGLEASVTALGTTAQALSIAAVVLLPWVAVLLVLGLLLLLLWRVARGRRAR